MALIDKIQDASIKSAIVADCVQLMDAQVAAKGGLGGMALKAAYGVVKGIDKGYVSGAIARLLPDTLSALEPLWVEGQQAGDPVAHLTQNTSRTADLILSTTDERIQRTGNGVIRSTYNKLRNSIKGDVEEAVPGLAKILGSHF
jgi:hypothetical protein